MDAMTAFLQATVPLWQVLLVLLFSSVVASMAVALLKEDR